MLVISETIRLCFAFCLCGFHSIPSTNRIYFLNIRVLRIICKAWKVRSLNKIAFCGMFTPKSLSIYFWFLFTHSLSLSTVEWWNQFFFFSSFHFFLMIFSSNIVRTLNLYTVLYKILLFYFLLRFMQQ